VNLLVHFAEKILLLNPTNARGDYQERYYAMLDEQAVAA
jgi:hypothetical protein